MKTTRSRISSMLYSKKCPAWQGYSHSHCNHPRPQTRPPNPIITSPSSVCDEADESPKRKARRAAVTKQARTRRWRPIRTSNHVFSLHLSSRTNRPLTSCLKCKSKRKSSSYNGSTKHSNSNCNLKPSNGTLIFKPNSPKQASPQNHNERKPKQTVIWQWSCTSFSNRNDDLLQFYQHFTIKPDIILLQELNGNAKAPGFISHKDPKGRSTATLIKNNLPATHHITPRENWNTHSQKSTPSRSTNTKEVSSYSSVIVDPERRNLGASMTRSPKQFD
ncbi:hypothetical protein HPB48_026499 [Haemaphysalis longicornis]|uniref:Endonuclease/exonuclease/phosphatase domain-containing protein n=1 Tax=Haemaphysalis longicornis TaxID=44386 RepID=A0A9J6H9W5_HAELO|nr:hypothetical protein HPB48_026499 [Haemaphysalis longicornis]